MEAEPITETGSLIAFAESVEVILKPRDLAQPPLEYAMSRLSGKSGLALEFGVAGGASLRTIVATNKFDHVMGFDCWQGLPEAWIGPWGKGSFSQAGVKPDVPGAVLVSGLFQDTVATFFDNLSSDAGVRLVHIDCDLYSAASCVLSALAHYLERAGPAESPIWLVFDELRGFDGHLDGEMKALYEMIVAHPRLRCFIVGCDQRPVVGELLQYYTPDAACPFRVATYVTVDKDDAE